jgi:cell division septation protein DedD
MAKFQEKLAELNLSEDALSKRIRDNINAFRKLDEAINGVKESIGETQDESEKEDLESELEELVQSLDEVDNKLVTDIIKFDKNKEHYAKLSKNLNKGGGTPKATTPKATSTPKATTPTPTPTPTPNNDASPKKKSNWGWVALGLVVLVATAGAVNVMNKR